MNLVDVTGSPVLSYFGATHLWCCGDAEAARFHPLDGYVRNAHVNVSDERAAICYSLSSSHDGWGGAVVPITAREQNPLGKYVKGVGNTACASWDRPPRARIVGTADMLRRLSCGLFMDVSRTNVNFSH